jgi:hypothetical protein
MIFLYKPLFSGKKAVTPVLLLQVHAARPSSLANAFTV